MIVRTARRRPATPFVVLLLAVLVHTACGPLLACHDTPQNRWMATVATVTVSPDHRTAECPGCALDEAPHAESPTRSPAAEDLLPPDEGDSCTPDRPCHGPSGSHAAEDVALRGLDSPRDPAPAHVPACLRPDRAERPALPAPKSSPVPPAAVLAPVAVLCVDRN